MARRKNPGAATDIGVVLTILGLAGATYILYKNGFIRLPGLVAETSTGEAHIIVQKKATTATITTDSLLNGLHGLGYTEITALSASDWWEVTVPAGRTVADAAAEIVALPEVESVLDVGPPVPPSPVPPPSVTPPSVGGFWVPPLNVSWHWMIDHPLDVTNAKDMGLTDPRGNMLSTPVPTVYDIDAFMNGQDPNCNIRDVNGNCVQGKNDAVAQLHAMGKKVIAYIDCGVYEDYREDAYKFPASVIGNPDKGWAGSYWLDVRQITILQPIMRARMQMCKDKGYDAIEPDEIDGYSNNPGFPMTYQDQLNYNRMLADMAHSMGMSILLKGDIDQAKDLVNDFDFTLNEECAQYNECNLLNVFTAAGKCVLQAEYKGTVASFCPAANAANRNAILFPLNLNGGRQPCR